MEWLEAYWNSVAGSELFIIFAILFLGYAIGRITVCGLSLGSAGVLLVALVFGHFGVTVPDIVGDIGLILFVAAVGLIAGPNFFRNFKINAKSYILLGVIIILAGALTCAAGVFLQGVPSDVSAGLLSGAENAGDYTEAVIVTTVLCIAFIAVSIPIFNKKEI